MYLENEMNPWSFSAIGNGVFCAGIKLIGFASGHVDRAIFCSGNGVGIRDKRDMHPRYPFWRLGIGVNGMDLSGF